MDPVADPASLDVDEIQVWIVDLAVGGDVAVGEPLDDAERARAAGLRSDADRRRYVTTHLVLRQLLGRVTATVPGAVAIERAPCARCGQPHGKPRLAGVTDVRFNISRCDDLALLAIGRGHEVGIDVEQRSAADGVAEVAALIAASADHPGDTPGLLDLWTRKEAVLKATGAGLTVDPLAVSVGGTSGDSGWRPARVKDDGTWVVRDLALDSGHAAAIATTVPPRRVVVAPWTGP